MLLFRIGQTTYSERITEAERRPTSMAALRLAKDYLAAQIATSLSTPANNPLTQFPNKIRPLRPSVRRWSRLAYALLSRSVAVNDGENCFLPKMALEGVITDERLDAAVGQASTSFNPHKDLTVSVLASGQPGSRIEALFNEQSAPNPMAEPDEDSCKFFVDISPPVCLRCP